MQSLTQRLARHSLAGHARASSSVGLIYHEHGRAEDVLQLVNPEVRGPDDEEVLVQMMAVSAIFQRHRLQKCRIEGCMRLRTVTCLVAGWLQRLHVQDQTVKTHCPRLKYAGLPAGTSEPGRRQHDRRHLSNKTNLACNARQRGRRHRRRSRQQGDAALLHVITA